MVDGVEVAADPNGDAGRTFSASDPLSKQFWLDGDSPACPSSNTFGISGGREVKLAVHTSKSKWGDTKGKVNADFCINGAWTGVQVGADRIKGAIESGRGRWAVERRWVVGMRCDGLRLLSRPVAVRVAGVLHGGTVRRGQVEDVRGAPGRSTHGGPALDREQRRLELLEGAAASGVVSGASTRRGRRSW